MARSLKKGPFVELYLLEKIDKMNSAGVKKPIKTWSRRSMVTPDFVGHTFLVVGCVALVQGLAAQGNSSLSESKTENAGASNTAVAGVLPAASANSQPRKLSGLPSEMTASGLLQQNEDLQRQLSIAQESLKALTS